MKLFKTIKFKRSPFVFLGESLLILTEGNLMVNEIVMNILELELLTDDLIKTEVFYNEVLGLQTVSKNESYISFIAGATKLTFRPSENLNPVYHFAFDIPKNKLMEAFSKIEKKTEILEVIPPDKIADFYNWNAKPFYCYDNHGNIIEFLAIVYFAKAPEKFF